MICDIKVVNGVLVEIVPCISGARIVVLVLYAGTHEEYEYADEYCNSYDDDCDGQIDEDAFERWASLEEKDRLLPWQNICPDDWSFCATDCGVPDEEIPF